MSIEPTTTDLTSPELSPVPEAPAEVAPEAEADEEVDDTKAIASGLVQQLISGGMTPQDIADAMDNRVSGRTIYRWAKGESGPQQSSGIKLLQALVDQQQQQPTKDESE